jgi:hypothetical protein
MDEVVGHVDVAERAGERGALEDVAGNDLHVCAPRFRVQLFGRAGQTSHAQTARDELANEPSPDVTRRARNENTVRRGTVEARLIHWYPS